jgi:DNA-binding ferritin-like protein
LFDKHFEQQSELVDAIAERIQLLGGVSLGHGTGCGGNDPHSAAPSRP